MERLSTSEKIKVELSRKGMNQSDLAKKLDITDATMSRRMKENIWRPSEIFYMKHALKFDL